MKSAEDGGVGEVAAGLMVADEFQTALHQPRSTAAGPACAIFAARESSADELKCMLVS
jgi:hypothetical protein